MLRRLVAALGRPPALYDTAGQRISAHLVLVFLVALAVYLATLPRTVALEDDGLFILASYFNGIAHPPGYPLHTLLGRMFTLIPLGTVAARVHVLSAVFGALTAAVLWWIGFRLLGSRAFAYAGAWAYAFSRTFWSQAIIAEVYTLNTFLFFLLFALGLRLIERSADRSASGPGRPLRLAGTLGLFYGLSLTNHLPLMALATPGLLVLLWPARVALLRAAPLILSLVAVGLLPYAWMYWHSQSDPPISFYGPMRGWQEFWFYVSREGYAGTDHSLTAGWYDHWQFAGFVLRALPEQVTWLGAVLAGVGFVVQWRRWPPAVSLALALAFLSNSFILVLLLGFDYDLLHQAVFRVYPLVSYGVLALWLGLGGQWVVVRVSDWSGSRLRPALASGMLVALVVFATFAANLPADDRHRYHWADDYGRAILDSVAPGAVLFVDADSEAGPVGYLHLVEGVRPDVALYNGWGLLFSNRLFRPYTLTRREADAVLRKFVDASGRPLYYISDLPHSAGVREHWPVRAVDESAPGKTAIEWDEHTLGYLRDIAGQTPPTDPWTSILRRRLLASAARRLAASMCMGSADQRRRLAPYLRLASKVYDGKLERVRAALWCGNDRGGESLLELLAEAERQKRQEPPIYKQDDAALYALRGRVLEQGGDVAAAVANYREALRRWPSRDNGARTRLEALAQRHAAAVP